MNILKISFVYFFTLIINSLLIVEIGTGIANTIAIISYIILAIWLIRIFNKLYARSSKIEYSVKKVIIMLVFSCTIFACSKIAEIGLASFFIPNQANYSLRLIEVFTAIIFAPISEEVFFRGIVLYQINRRYSFLIANIIQAVIFSLLHFDLNTFVFILLFGIMQGIVCNYLNIYCSILIHSLSNLSTVIIRIFINSIELLKYEYLLAGVVFFIITVGLLMKIRSMSKYVIE